jgi:choline dehydrogenase-like flavoprotein
LPARRRLPQFAFAATPLACGLPDTCTPSPSLRLLAMPLITPKDIKPLYDAIVVGSGAAGAQAAYTLTMGGAKVLMLEAGRNYDPVSETPMFQEPFQAPLRAASTPDKSRGFYNATVNGGWTIEGEPYSNASSRRGESFSWWRSRMLGGRTNHWERNSFRNGPYDFKPYSRDGLGVDWPIGYEDLAPYYDKVEQLIGVFGASEGIENSPDSPPGILLPAPEPRIGERLVQARARRLGIPVVPIHRAVLTARLDHEKIPARLHPGNVRAQRILAESMSMRAACFWATHCERGCSIRANYQSPTVHLPPALATGNLDLLTGARACEIITNPDGKARGVRFVTVLNGEEFVARAKVVILGASSFESVRLLFNSKSSRFPGGIGNSSGWLGRGIMNSVGTSLTGQVPLLENLPPHNEDGAGGGHVFIPWWLSREQQAGKLNFPRGYHVEFETGRRMPNCGTPADMGWLCKAGFGRGYKEDLRRYYGSLLRLTGRGEMIPNERSFCEIDPELKDRWGVPALKFHWHWSEHERRQAAHMKATFAAVIESVGGRIKGSLDQPASLQSLTHEVGGARMGADAKHSVTNQWGQSWDVPNVFVVDGATFCSSAEKNPTLTILALAWRAGDFILGELARGNL